MKPRLSRVRREAAELGRDPDTIAVRASTIPEMRDELHRFADEVIANTLDL